MAATNERQLARLKARFYERTTELARVGFLMRGSIIKRFSRCGSSGCACHADPPQFHGPYWQWTTKVKGKTVTRNLSEKQKRRYEEWMDNAKRVDQILAELYQISTEADAILRNVERQERKRR
jgi:hypothetical protein